MQTTNKKQMQQRAEEMTDKQQTEELRSDLAVKGGNAAAAPVRHQGAWETHNAMMLCNVKHMGDEILQGQ